MALSMVMNMLMASSRKAGRKGLLFRTWQIWGQTPCRWSFLPWC